MQIQLARGELPGWNGQWHLADVLAEALALIEPEALAGGQRQLDIDWCLHLDGPVESALIEVHGTGQILDRQNGEHMSHDGRHAGSVRWAAPTMLTIASTAKPAKLLLAATLVLALTACSDETPEETSPIPAPPFRHQTFYEQLGGAAESFGQLEGDWIEDYGDATFYGLAYYTYTSADPAGDARVQAARKRARSLLDNADFFEDDINEMAMAAFGLIAYIDATGDKADLPLLDIFIDRIDALLSAIGWYLQPGAVDSWALSTYGSTAVSALIGLINAEYATEVGGPRAAERRDWAVEMASRIDEAAFDGSMYAIGPDREGLYLYPHVSMIMLNGRLFQLTGKEAYRQRANLSYEAIQPLKLSDAPARYQSPYSAEYMGAKTDDYTTLSSHNYLMLALSLLFRINSEPAYAEELDSVLDGLEDELLGSWCLSHVHLKACTPTCSADDVCVTDSCVSDSCSAGVLHHWIDGDIAQPADAEYFCSGCNLQLLYVMYYRQHKI